MKILWSRVILSLKLTWLVDIMITSDVVVLGFRPLSCYLEPGLRKGFDKETGGINGDITSVSGTQCKSFWSTAICIRVVCLIIRFMSIRFLTSIRSSRFIHSFEMASCSFPRPGFLKSIQIMLRVREGGLATAGPPCGSFVYLNVATSGRSRTKPLGNPKRNYVRDANTKLDWRFTLTTFQEYMCWFHESWTHWIFSWVVGPLLDNLHPTRCQGSQRDCVCFFSWDLCDVY